MIGNAHLDPVWLWNRSDGVDTALATARSACDRLDEYPEFVFTCSGSWFHEQAARLDAPLMARIRAHVEAGRWALVGGMVIQPDCNLPMAESFARQLAVGQAWYERAFGRRTTVGYNVDSFGHTAYLPRLLREAGIDAYCFMRPGPHEKTLPAGLFRWRSPDGAEVTAFRIPGAYTTGAAEIREPIEAALAAVPPGVDHTMCFYGVGDHGGGPTRAQIEWLIANAGAFAGARLVFSHPRAFFDAVADQAAALPVVEGELQHHAIGCYSVERRIKVAMRRAEARLLQAGQAAETFAAATTRDDLARTELAWRAVLFNQFHDMLGGTCIAEAGAAVAGELTAAEAEADAVVTDITRRALRPEARPGEHRVALVNPSPEPFDGIVTHEPWGTPQAFDLLDEDGRPVACQVIEPRAKVGGLRRILFRVTIAARGRRMLRVVGRDGPAMKPPPPAPSGRKADPLAALEGWTLSLDVHDDPSDTWSHGAVSRFRGRRLGQFRWREGWEPVEAGPIRAAWRTLARFGNSRMWIRAMQTEGEPGLRLGLAVVWAEPLRRLVLRLAAPAPLDERADLVSGGPLARPLDGLEYPLGGGLAVAGGGQSLAIVAPEVFSASATPDGVALTLLRSPYMAWHDPFPGAERPDVPVTDQGTHAFDVVLCPGAGTDLAAPARLARQMLMPPVVWDLTG